MERASPDVRIEPTRCPFCHDAIPRGEAPAVCAACHAMHHAECLREHGRCAGCGAGGPAPVGVARRRPRAAFKPASLEQPSWSGPVPVLLYAIPAGVLLGGVLAVCAHVIAQPDVNLLEATVTAAGGALIGGILGVAFARGRERAG